MLLRTSAFLLFLLSVMIVTVPPDGALAQNPMLNALQPDLEKAAGDGATVIVIAPPAKDQDEDGQTLSAKEAWQQNILAARAEAKRLLPRLGELPGAINSLLRSQGEPGQLGWLAWSVGIALGGILTGLGCAWLVRRKTVKYLDMVRVANPVTRADKFPFLLVRSLLEIAKVSGSMGGTELTSVRIDELLMRIPAELKKVNPMYDVNIEFDQLPEDASALIIYGNEHLLYSSIKNIVHNACKFSEDKKADIVLSFSGDTVIIAIHDKGPGIDAHDLEHIFQPFYRSNRHQSYVSGAGLGLPLAQRIIGLHKGNIEVKSKIGKGTTFIITLPIEGVVAPDGSKTSKGIRL